MFPKKHNIQVIMSKIIPKHRQTKLLWEDVPKKAKMSSLGLKCSPVMQNVPQSLPDMPISSSPLSLKMVSKVHKLQHIPKINKNA